MDDATTTVAAAECWAILPSALELKTESFGRRTSPPVRRTPTVRVSLDGDAVVPICGTILPRDHTVPAGMEATSAEGVAHAVVAAASAPGVRRIVLWVDSHGGCVAGVAEAADLILDVAARIPVVAVVQYVAVGAAYWLASQAGDIVAAPSAMVGGIGVVSAHIDTTRAQALAGQRLQLSVAGTYKGEGVGGRPLPPEGLDARAAIVDEQYTAFVDAVARARAVSPTTVREGYGQGRILTASQALAAGMVDYIGTLAALPAP